MRRTIQVIGDGLETKSYLLNNLMNPRPAQVGPYESQKMSSGEENIDRSPIIIDTGCKKNFEGGSSTESYTESE